MQHFTLMRGLTSAVIAGILALGAGCATQIGKEAAQPVQPDKDLVTIGERLSIHSDILKEDRPYLVYLPET